MKNIFHLFLFLFLKSIYSLSIIYFLFPLFLSNPIRFILSLSSFNHLLCWLVAAPNDKFNRIKVVGFGLISGWVLVVIGGGDWFSLKGIALGSLLSSVAFNSLIFNCSNLTILYELIEFIFNLNFMALYKKDPLILTLIFASIGSLIGTLMAGLVVVLDWNVTWQVFPIPNVIGCVLGEFFGILISLILSFIFRLNQ